MPGKLYVVATPIGNLEDITARAKRILEEVDIIAAEDTRNTQKLLGLLGIGNRTVSNHKFNERDKADSLVAELSEGNNIAVVSDAGTPCISDPGFALVAAAAAAGIEVIGISGASAVITALSVSGFGFDAFAFYGFFPREKKEINETIDKIKRDCIPVSVFYESPQRIIKTLRVIADDLPGSELCLCNDLTKLHERIYRGSPAKVLAELEDNPSADKGEYTLVMRFSEPPAAESPADELSPEALIFDYAAKNGGSAKDAVTALAKSSGGKYSKSDLYKASLRLKEIARGLFPSGN